MRFINNEFQKRINYDLIKRAIKIKIEDKIKKEIQIPYEKFIDFMKKCDISICGSFILQCIIDENYNKGIDLCVEFNPELFNEFELIQNRYPQYRTRYYTTNRIYGNNNDDSIRFIQSNKLPKLQFVKEMTDFDICKNLYDANGNLYIHDLIGIFDKKEKLSAPCLNYYTDARKKKYLKRGFVFEKLKVQTSYQFCDYSVPVIIYTKTHFMINDEIYEINNNNWRYNFLIISDIFKTKNVLKCYWKYKNEYTAEQNFDTDIDMLDKCAFDTICEDVKHTHYYDYDESESIDIILIKYETCDALANFQKLESYM